MSWSEEPPEFESRQTPTTEALLRRLVEMVNSARPMPLSASVIVNRDEVLEMLEEASARLPEELRSARWLLKEREEFLLKVQREGEDILDAARARAERMVQRTEVVKAAEQRARSIVEAAETAARRMRHEAEDFCDQKLAGFEIVLERTMKMVQAGREKLQAAPLAPAERASAIDAPEPAPPAAAPASRSAPPGVASGFFDQDQA